MSRCTNPFGVRLSVDVPNKVVIYIAAGNFVIVVTIGNADRWEAERDSPEQNRTKQNWQINYTTTTTTTKSNYLFFLPG